MKKKCKVVMLPTGAITNIKIRQGKLQCYYGDETEFIYTGKLPDNIYQYLYLISDDKDDKIKGGDWCYTGQLVRKCVDFAPDGCPRLQLKGKDRDGQVDYPDAKKVIASTDPALHVRDNSIYVDGKTEEILMEFDAPELPESFIKTYVEAGGIDEVMVEYDEIPEYDYNADYVERFINVLKLTENNEVIISMVEENL